CRNLRHRVIAGHLQHDLALSDDPQQLYVLRAIDGADPMRLGRIWEDVRGVTAVEFAITAPGFFAIIFGMFEVGLVLWTQIRLQPVPGGVHSCGLCSEPDKTASSRWHSR